MITEIQLNKAITYAQYKKVVEQELAQGKSTGDIQTEEYLNFSKLNIQRMNRLDKTIVIQAGLAEALRELDRAYYFVVLSEGWCGDAAQNVPVIAALEKETSAIEVKVLLRDQNPDLMNQYLTNGSRSIPKLICFEKDSLVQKFVWGPRPKVLQDQVLELLKKHASKEEKGLFVQNWYNSDKTLTLQQELLDLVRSL